MKHSTWGAGRRIILMAGLALGLAGCGSPVNQRNYDQLKMGMEFDQVVKLLGKPSECDAVMAIKNCRWGKPPAATISVRFIADQVVLFKAQGL
ncbi:SmpA / OmlA family protein [Methylomagnum ishizawai]|uniref:SmpA / OmlA family protein n=1 Tax=Methylomagnum ishizawai TaxID=1760988 RepID=A0A1Y6D342_9GAMM|nr:outer membrane protein assembly factor BamE [Methylomagnum ishizawai]SMF97016.1 SmpA / OmlA family protein [Methylomagnum ishizawai]